MTIYDSSILIEYLDSIDAVVGTVEDHLDERDKQTFYATDSVDSPTTPSTLPL
ncbi:PIN domain-containing protein [Halalkalicoccus salilacus]|uniref:hypothetical protein n=1 Tax=Halalkalicoccus TaxID=332246 RepID=UPI002F96AF61